MRKAQIRNGSAFDTSNTGTSNEIELLEGHSIQSFPHNLSRLNEPNIEKIMIAEGGESDMV